MADPLKNLQAAARRRGLSLHKAAPHCGYSFVVVGRQKKITASHEKPMTFEDLAEVRDELRLYPTG
jgi:hypothetical protein